MRKWDGCRVIACKNDLCDRECQYLARLKSEAAIVAMTPEEWERERSIAEQLNRVCPTF